MTTQEGTRRGPAPATEAEVEVSAKQARIDKGRAARSPRRRPVTHTADNALAGGPALAAEKAARGKKKR